MRSNTQCSFPSTGRPARSDSFSKGATSGGKTSGYRAFAISSRRLSAFSVAAWS